MTKNKQSGFAHLAILTIVLAVVVIGLLGFVFYQNFIQKKSTTLSDAASTSKTTPKTSSSTTPSTDTKTPVTDTNKGYLVLSDWGVKFKLPKTLGSNMINYYQSGGYETPTPATGYSYAFTTSNQEALGQHCTHTSSQFMPIGYLGRQTTPQSSDAVSGGLLLGKIGSYYYYFTGSQAPCSDQDRGTDNAMILKFVKGIEQE